MQLGISSYTYPWAMGVRGYEYVPVMDHADLIKKTKELGIHLLQIADNAPLHELDRRELEALSDLARASGVEIEIGARGFKAGHLETCLEICDIFGASLLRFVADQPAEGWFPSVETIVELCRSFEPTLEQKDIHLVIENHERLTTDDIRRIMEETGSPRIGICLDCANSLGAGEGIHETVDKLAPYTRNLHLKDIRIGRKSHMMGFDILGAPFGQGIIPLPWVLSKMPVSCRSAILELWVPPADTTKATIEKEALWAVESLDYLKKIIK